MRRTWATNFLSWPIIALSFLVLLAFIGTAWLSVAQVRGYNTQAFDLGAMSQAIWSVTEGRPLISTHKGLPLSRLAGQVEVFYFLLAPIYKLFPFPSTLLLIQAFLYAAAAVPVYRMACRHLQSRWGSVGMAAIYLLYPVAQTAVLFEFHGDTLGMALLMFAIEAADRRAWKQYALWIALALSCKFYVAVPVLALGLYLWVKGDRRPGAGTILASTIWGIFTFFVLRNLFAPDTIADAAKATPIGYLGFYFGQLLQVGNTLLPRLATGLLVYTPAVLLGRRAPGWLLLSASITVPVLLSTGPGPSFRHEFHHYALAVPFLVTAIIYGTESVMQQASPPIQWQQAVGFTLVITALINALAVDTPLNPTFYNADYGSGQGMSATGYGIVPRDHFKDAWLAQLPPDAALSADRLSALRLTNRSMLVLNRPLLVPLATALPQLDIVVTDALFDFVMGTPEQILQDGVATEHETIAFMLQQLDWRLTRANDGLLQFEKRGDGLPQTIELVPPDEETEFVHQFDGKIALVAADIQQVGNNRLRIQCDWMALTSLQVERPLIAVSEIEGIPQSRMVHLPTLGLQPTTTWPTDQIIRETFAVTIPEDLPSGQYPVRVGWYDTGSVFAAATDERSRVGDTIVIGTIER